MKTLRANSSGTGTGTRIGLNQTTSKNAPRQLLRKPARGSTQSGREGNSRPLQSAKNFGKCERAKPLSQKIVPGGKLSTHRSQPAISGRARESRSPLALKSSPAACTPETGADFCVGKFHFPEQKSLPCTICGQSFPKKTQANCGGGGRRRRIRRILRFRPAGETAAAQIENLRRGTWRGSLLPRPPFFISPFQRRTALPRPGRRARPCPARSSEPAPPASETACGSGRSGIERPPRNRCGRWRSSVPRDR